MCTAAASRSSLAISSRDNRTVTVAVLLLATVVMVAPSEREKVHRRAVPGAVHSPHPASSYLFHFGRTKDAHWICADHWRRHPKDLFQTSAGPAQAAYRPDQQQLRRHQKSWAGVSVNCPRPPPLNMTINVVSTSIESIHSGAPNASNASNQFIKSCPSGVFLNTSLCALLTTPKQEDTYGQYRRFNC